MKKWTDEEDAAREAFMEKRKKPEWTALRDMFTDAMSAGNTADVLIINAAEVRKLLEAFAEE